MGAILTSALVPELSKTCGYVLARAMSARSSDVSGLGVGNCLPGCDLGTWPRLPATISARDGATVPARRRFAETAPCRDGVPSWSERLAAFVATGTVEDGGAGRCVTFGCG